MAAIDYEAEYNNRARVPEYAQIFERWARDAAAYRNAAIAAKRAEVGLKYGASDRQTIDLFFPDSGAQAPLALFVHGGYWRSLEPSMFSHMALGLNMRGIAVAVAGYDLCPQISIAGIVDEMRNACLYLWRRYGKRLFIYGHSAGGHVAAALMATDWKAIDLQAPVDLVPAACAISGLFDLMPLVEISGNADFRLDAASARAVSPLFWPAPRGATLDLVVGGAESGEFLRQSRSIAEVWGKAGVVTRYEAVAGMNHFTVIDALTIPHGAMVDRLAVLATHASKSS